MFMISTNLNVLRTMVVSPDGRQLVAGGRVTSEGPIPAVELWNLSDWHRARPHLIQLRGEWEDKYPRGSINQAFFVDKYPRGSINQVFFVDSHLVAICRWEDLFIIDPSNQTWKRCELFKRPKELSLWSNLWLGFSNSLILGHLTCMAVSPDGRSVAIGGNGRHLIDLFNWRLGNYSIYIHTPKQKRWFSLTSGWGQLGALAWSPCCRLLAGIIGAQLVVWDVGSGEVVADRLRTARTQLFRSPVFHPSGHFLAAAGANGPGRVAIWDTHSWRLLTEYEWPIGEVRQLAFSPDGLLGFAADNEGHILVWDVDLIEWL